MEKENNQTNRSNGFVRKIASVMVAVSAIVANAGTSANASIQTLIDTAKNPSIQAKATAAPAALVFQPAANSPMQLAHGSHSSHSSHSSHASHASHASSSL